MHERDRDAGRQDRWGAAESRRSNPVRRLAHRRDGVVARLFDADSESPSFSENPRSHGRATLAAELPRGVIAYRVAATRHPPVRVVPEKTRIAFQVRMSFEAVSLRRDRIVGHVVLARRLENPRFTKIETISPRNHVLSFRFHSREELDREVLRWLREAYLVGQQRHLQEMRVRY